MILKSFLRKRTTKIYLIILTIITSLVGIVGYSKINYTKKGNENYSNSEIVFVASKEEYSKIKKLKNVKEVIVGLVPSDTLDYSPYNSIHYFKNSNLKGHDALMGSWYINEVNAGEYTLKFQNNPLDLNIIAEKEDTYYHTYIFDVDISPELFAELNAKTNLYYYRLKLNNWFKYEQTEKLITKKIKVLDYTDTYGTFTTLTNKLNGNQMYPGYILIYNISFIALSILWFIITFITIHNLLVDEKNTVYLYSCLGYNKKTIKKNNLLKVLTIFLLALLISLIIVIIFGILFRHA